MDDTTLNLMDQIVENFNDYRELMLCNNLLIKFIYY
jgi:hypothetical protein